MELDRSVSVVCARASGRSVRAVLSKAFLSWIALALLLGLAPASAQTSFAGKTITVLSGFGSGGAVDLWARLVAHHIGKHLPGRPNAVVQNMPGAGGLNALNHLYNVAPNDGTVMGITVGYTALAPITGASGARFDPTKLTWLGKPTGETNICMARNAPQVKVKSAGDLLDNELIVGSTGPGAGSYSYPKGLSALLGLKFKIIAGFPSASSVVLAMERGEVDGLCQSFAGISLSRPDWIANKTVLILLRGGKLNNPALPGVPFVGDLARTPGQRQAVEFLYAADNINRSFIAPPRMPAERVGMLRTAFATTMKDPEFLADAKKHKLEVEPEEGEQLAAFIRKIYDTPAPIVQNIVELIK
jgi:tripartite-type tricarboxylate transporter receptor subunit TctC